MRSTYFRAAGIAATVVVAVCVAGADAASYAVSGLDGGRIADQFRRLPCTGMRSTAPSPIVVVRDGVFLGRVTTTSFTDSALTQSGIHTYRVRGIQKRRNAVECRQPRGHL